MGIFRGSRYRILEPIQVEDSDGTVSSCHKLRETTNEPPLGSRRHSAEAGDTFESLAFKYYGDGNKWYVIADVNPQIFWPLDLQSGMEVIIPPRSYAELT